MTSMDDGDLERIIDVLQRVSGVEAITPDQELLDSGLVSSIDMVDVFVFLNQHFHIEVRNRDMIPDNFRTARRILSLARSYQADRAGLSA